MIQAGKLRHSVKVQRITNEKDDTGRVVKGYETVFSMRCNIKFLSGSERVKAGINLSKEYISIKARFDRRLQHKHFINWRGSLYSVEAIGPSDNELEVIITAEREVK